jgi:hypothetical protein
MNHWQLLSLFVVRVALVIWGFVSLAQTKRLAPAVPQAAMIS